MIQRMNDYLFRAGFTGSSAYQFAGIAALALTLLSLVLYGLTNSVWITSSTQLCLVAQLIEVLNNRVAKRTESQNQDWPKFLDAIHSAAWAGSSIQDAIFESRNFAPATFSEHISEFEKDSVGGMSFDHALDNLKARLASPIGDRFIEMTRLAQTSGGRGYLAALRSQSIQLRIENATWNEIRVKQNWVLSTAKMAVLAPWLVLLVLGSRRETALAFETETGIAVLLIGLLASLLAFKLIKTLGKLPTRRRTLL